MQKQAGKAKSGLGTNYKMLIGVFVFFIFAIPSLLLFFEHKAYLSEKKSAAYCGSFSSVSALFRSVFCKNLFSDPCNFPLFVVNC